MASYIIFCTSCFLSGWLESLLILPFFFPESTVSACPTCTSCLATGLLAFYSPIRIIRIHSIQKDYSTTTVPKSSVYNNKKRSITEELPFGNWVLWTTTSPSMSRKKVKSTVEVPNQMLGSSDEQQCTSQVLHKQDFLGGHPGSM